MTIHAPILRPVLLAFALLATGCSDPASTATSPSMALADQLGGTWTLVSAQPPDAAEQTVPSGASYTLTFAAGQISTRADCNTCNGAFTVSGQTVTVGSALACTRALCPTAAFADLYVRVLSGESTATVSGATLRLSSTRGVLRFTRG